MKIERINENKIRITLSEKDLEERHLDFKSLRYNSPETQNLFWDMMKKAETEHGFTASNCQLFVEAASVMDGHFIVTITKMPDIASLPRIPYIKGKSSPSNLKVKKKALSNPTICIVKFASFDNLYDAVAVTTLPVNLSSCVYEYNKAYYLLLKPNISQLKLLPRVLFLLGEFGEVVYDSAYIEGILSEYGNKVINKDALKKLRQ
jgi:adapter protein MecA 1/2